MSKRGEVERILNEVDSKLDEVKRKLDEVQRKLEAETCSNGPDVKYWMEKRRDLWKENGLLWEEYRLLSDKKLELLSVIRSLCPTFENVVRICNEFSNRITPMVQQIPSTYKAQFPSSIRPVCSLNNKPCLLWEGAGDGLVKIDDRISTRHSLCQVTVLSTPSGSGKTRTMIELGCKMWSFFFVGDQGPLAGFGRGSLDVKTALLKMEELNGDYFALRLVVCALLIARLTVLDVLLQLKPDLHPRDWVFFQLEYPGVHDYFMELVDSLFSLVRDESDARSALTHFEKQLRQLTAKAWKQPGVVVIDEAQELSRHKFKPTQIGGSSLNAFVAKLHSASRDSLNSSVFVSGIERSSMVDPKLSHSYPIYVINHLTDSAFDETNIPAFLERFIDVRKVDMEMIVARYRGRPRFLTAAVEQYITTNNPGRDWFERFSQMMVQPNKT